MFRVFLYQSQMKELQINYRVFLDLTRENFFYYYFLVFLVMKINYKSTKLQYKLQVYNYSLIEITSLL
jgi:hypothetical protein